MNVIYFQWELFSKRIRRKHLIKRLQFKWDFIWFRKQKRKKKFYLTYKNWLDQQTQLNIEFNKKLIPYHLNTNNIKNVFKKPNYQQISINIKQIKNKQIDKKQIINNLKIFIGNLIQKKSINNKLIRKVKRKLIRKVKRKL